MEITLIIIKQCVVMFVFMIIGAYLSKTGKLTTVGAREIGTILLQIIIPTVIVKGFCVEPTPERIQNLCLSFLLAAIALIISMLISRIIFKKHPIDNFAASFSNAGFIGVALVQAVLGSEAVFYVSGFIAMLFILQWTYGVSTLTNGRAKCTARVIFLNPLTISTAVGLLLFFTGFGARMPSIFFTAADGITTLNSPLAMFVLGAYFAQVKIKSLLLTPRMYLLSLIRLLVIPVVTMLFLALIPSPAEIKLAVLLVSSAPAGANVAIYASQHGLDYGYSSQAVVLTTILSMLTLPVLSVVFRVVLN